MRLLAIILLAFVVNAHDGTAQQPTVVYVVRHAETTTHPDDRDLSDIGRDRANELARVLADAGITVVYSTPLRRTIGTALPTAQLFDLEIKDTPLVSDFADNVARLVNSEPPGSRILVSSHSNTVPPIVNALTGSDLADLSEDEFDDLFVVTIPVTGPSTFVRLHYGATSP